MTSRAFFPSRPSGQGCHRPRFPKGSTQMARVRMLPQPGEFSKKSNGRRAPWRACATTKPRPAITDGEIGAWGNNIEMVGLDQHPINRLRHKHRCVACQQVHHHAFVGRVEMLDQDKSHAVSGWQRAYQLSAGIKAAGRSTNRDDRELVRAGRRVTYRYGAPARPTSVRFDLARMTVWHYAIVFK